MHRLILGSLAVVMSVFTIPLTAEAAFTGTVGSLSDGGKLVGTSYNPHNDTLSGVNDVIGDDAEAGSWNKTFGPGTTANLSALPLATAGPVHKFEETSPGSGILFDSVSGALGNFAFYQYNGTNTASVTDSDFSAIAANTVLTSNVVGFKWVGAAGNDAGFEYYSPKSDATNGGFSVWSYTAGAINLAYVDADGDLGGVADPRGKNGGFDISHISIYGTAVPEPSSLSLLGIGCVVLCGAGARRWRKKNRTV